MVLLPLAPLLPQVRMWYFDLEQPLAAEARACLSSDERARAARFIFAHDRQRYECAHIGLRQLLAQELGEASPEALRFATEPLGKPLLVDAPQLHFNLSHSGRYAAVAVAPAPVGVDIEVLRPMPDADALAQTHFSANEQRTLRALPSDERHHAFLMGWTRKEACLKAIGVGLGMDTRSVEVGLGISHQVVSVPDVTPGRSDPSRLRLASSRPAANIVLAVALLERAASAELRPFHPAVATATSTCAA